MEDTPRAAAVVQEVLGAGAGTETLSANRFYDGGGRQMEQGAVQEEE